MTSPIPYTQAAFNKIANNSRIMHNGQISQSVQNPFIAGTNTGGGEFISSFINELELYIQMNLYDVNIKELVGRYISHQMLKYGQYVKKDILKYIADLDMKYISIFKDREFLQNLFIPYLYTNTMITD